MRTPPVRPADGVVGCVYESFVPGERHRWLEKEILWFCFRRAEPERMISGWTKDSAKCIGPVRWPAAAECLTR